MSAKVVLAIAVLLLWSSPARCQKNEPEKPPGGSVEGIVVRAESEQPIKNARVMLRRADANFRVYRTATDTQGKFAINEIEPGRYSLRVAKNGFVTQGYAEKKPGLDTPLSLAPGQKIKDIMFRLVSAAAVIGRVVDEDGDPVPGVEVQALTAQPEKSFLEAFLPEQQRGSRVPRGRAITNDLGEYRIYSLRPGKYHISAVDTGNTALSDYGLRMGFGFGPEDEKNAIYPPIYYPGTFSRSDASTIPLDPGSEIRIDFRLFRQGAPVRIAGRVLSPNGRPMRAELELRPDWASPLFTGFHVKTEKDGSFDFKQIVPGTYLLRAQAEDETGMFAAREKINVIDEDINVLLLLARPRRITGKLIAERGVRLPRSFHIFLFPLDEKSEIVDGEVLRDGTFAFPQVEENTYRLDITSLGEDSFIKSIRYGMIDVLEQGFTVSKNTPGAELEVVVSAAASRLEGQVMNGSRKPEAGAIVYLIPKQESVFLRDRIRQARTDQRGNFNMRGIAPGKYRLVATDDDETELTSIDISLSENESRVVDLKAEPVETSSTAQ